MTSLTEITVTWVPNSQCRSLTYLLLFRHIQIETSHASWPWILRQPLHVHVNSWPYAMLLTHIDNAHPTSCGLITHMGTNGKRPVRVSNGKSNDPQNPAAHHPCVEVKWNQGVDATHLPRGLHILRYRSSRFLLLNERRSLVYVPCSRKQRTKVQNLGTHHIRHYNCNNSPA